MKKIIPKPVNWQDFESLCKKLYGEIWQCQSTISKNGRNGQSQNGVDIYGIPKGENEYFGIQCKGKDDYAKTELTEAEIDNEIENAKKFQPKLKQFIIATTGNKDAKIEEFVRKKNVDSRANGGFEIVVRHWEDLADLIEENQVTFDWYVSGKQFRKTFDIEIFAEKQNGLKYENHFSFNIFMRNVGNVVIEDWKLSLKFERGDFKYIFDDDKYEKFITSQNIASQMAYLSYATLREKYRRVFIYEENSIFMYVPLSTDRPLVQTETRSFQVFVIEPTATTSKLYWMLTARDFQKDGLVEISY